MKPQDVNNQGMYFFAESHNYKLYSQLYEFEIMFLPKI